MSKKQEPKNKKQAEEQVVSDHSDQKVEELTNDVKRIQAEFINYKNRVEEEKATLSQFSKSQVIKELLPVIDDLERALAHLPDELNQNKWAQGTQKIYSRLQNQLEKLGINKIDALNQPFDPELHEAIQAEGEGDEHIVKEVLQTGYIMNGIVIRHALVKVGAN